MYWVCEECGWENEYSDEVRYTECQCCGTPGAAKTIADAEEALNRFHREEERRRREEAIRQKKELRQQAFNNAMARFVNLSRLLPWLNLGAIAIAVLLVIGSFVAGDLSGPEPWNRLWTNLQEITCFARLEGSFETADRLLSNGLSAHFRALEDNSKSLAEVDPEALPENASLLWSGVRVRTDAVADSVALIGRRQSGLFSRLDANSAVYTDKISSQCTHTGVVLEKIGDRISEYASRFFQNTEYFWEKASENVTQLLDKIFKR